MRSCSSSVLVKQTAEQVTPADLSRLTVPDERRPGAWVRRLKAKRPVRPMGVVVLNVDSEHLLEVAATDDQQPVQTPSAHRPDPALSVSVRVGARTGVRSTSAPSEQNRSSNVRLNFSSRSRTTKRSRRPRSPSISRRLRACWVTQAPFGLAVTPARWTRRVSSSMKNSTYSRRSHTVSAVKKSQATISAAWWRRNARQVVVVRRGAGSSR
jgi:hypothetical protein